MKLNAADRSDETAYRLAYLIAGFLRKTLTEEEHDELDAWVEASDENMRLFEDLTDERNVDANLAWMEGVQTEAALQTTMQQLPFGPAPKTKRLPAWWPYAAAACLLLLIGMFLELRTGKAPAPPVANRNRPSPDTVPSGSGALLTLADGTRVDLQHAAPGTLRNEQGAAIQKQKEGELMYTTVTKTAELAYNSLATPKGKQYALTFSDGTRVWLNAQSSLRYPVQFGDSNRVVELQGEGYFDVAKDPKKPFVVRLADGEEIRVTGTQFNVSAYANEASKRVTLVEGRVQVRVGKAELPLHPGQQAVLKDSTVLLSPRADLDAVTAWKRGEFVFRDASLYDLLRQVERWYDVQVIYRAANSEHFNFTIARSEPVSKVLRLLEMTGKVHFKTENKTVYVLP